jgi:hypothetical protein
MAKKTLEACRKGDDYIGYALTHGGSVRPGKGSHKVVYGPKSNGRGEPVPCHNKDIGPNLRRKIVKAFLAMGLVLLLAVIVI